MTENIKIFAYGSLLNEASLKSTVPEASNIYPAKVYGFRRIFNLASHYRFCNRTHHPVCVLNLEKACPDTPMNGACFEMQAKSFEQLKSREQIYTMHEVNVHRYYDDQLVDKAILFWAKDQDLYAYLSASEAQHKYLSLCVEGCHAFSASFFHDFKMTTQFWNIEEESDIQRIWQGNY